jgi:hemerythrin superfamily protein
MSPAANKYAAAKSARRPAPRRAPAPPDAIALLKADHRTVRALLAQLVETTARGPKARLALLERVRAELVAHTAIEEEIFYPALREAGTRAGDEAMYFEALEEHRAAGDLVLPDLVATPAASTAFKGRAKVLRELVDHHAREEEKQMFARARQLLDAATLADLGVEMARRKAELLGR